MYFTLFDDLLQELELAILTVSENNGNVLHPIKKITVKKIIKILFIIGNIQFFLLVMLFGILVYQAQKSAIIPIHSSSSTKLSPEQYNTMSVKLTALVQQQNPRVALEALKKEMNQDPKVNASCHELLHELGRASYTKYHDFAKAMEYRDETCVSGYTHGVIEAYFAQNNDAVSSLTLLCQKYPQDTYIKWECIHGVGHGLMYYSGNNLPFSLRTCDVFKTAVEQGACYNGVFMENFNADTLLHPSRFVSLTDPFMSCKNSQKFKAECYENAPIYYFNQRNDDYLGALRWCDTLSLTDQLACYEGVGAQITRRHFTNPQFVEKICLSGDQRGQVSCISGMTAWYIDYYASLKPAENICPKLQEQSRKFCMLTIAANGILFHDL